MYLYAAAAGAQLLRIRQDEGIDGHRAVRKLDTASSGPTTGTTRTHPILEEVTPQTTSPPLKIGDVEGQLFSQYEDKQGNRTIGVYRLKPFNVNDPNSQYLIVSENATGKVYLHEVTLLSTGYTKLLWLPTVPSRIETNSEPSNGVRFSYQLSDDVESSFFKMVLESGFVSNPGVASSILQYREVIGDRTCYLLRVLVNGTDVYRLWGKVPASSVEGDQVELISRRDSTKSTDGYLRMVNVSKSGTAKLIWSDSVVKTEISLEDTKRGSTYIAEPSNKKESLAFYEKALKSAFSSAPDKSLPSSLAFVSTKLGQKTLSLAQRCRVDGGNVYSFWVNPDDVVKNPEPVIELRTPDLPHQGKGNSTFLTEVYLPKKGAAEPLGAANPAAFIAIRADFNGCAKCLGSLPQSENRLQFFSEALGCKPIASAAKPLQDKLVRCITFRNSNWCLDHQYVRSGQLVQEWLLVEPSGRSFERIVTKVLDNKIQYLKKAVKRKDGKIENTWVDVLSSAEFEEDGDIIHPTSSPQEFLNLTTDPGTTTIRSGAPVTTTRRNPTPPPSTSSRMPFTPTTLQSNAVLSIPPGRLWVAPEYYEKLVDIPPKFRSLVELSSLQRLELLRKLLPQLESVPEAEWKAVVEESIDKTLPMRNEWCSLTTSLDEDRKATSVCVDDCTEIVKDATILLAKNEEPRYPFCKFGYALRGSYVWSLVITFFLAFVASV